MNTEVRLDSIAARPKSVKRGCYSTRSIVLALGVAVLGCGGSVTDRSRSSADDGGTLDGATDAATEAFADAGWTPCSTPEGYSICGGPDKCNGPDGTCAEHGLCDWQIDAAIGFCYLSAANNSEWLDPCMVCEDGDVCVAQVRPDDLACAPFNAGLLFQKHGVGDLVRYSDKGIWTGDPLPLPSECPSIPGVPTCGGNCGGCSPGSKCVGRSPRHPYGLCVRERLDAQTWNGCGVGDAPHSCPASFGCFTFLVEPEAQPLADIYSFCLPNDQCLAAAKGLPGGGKCQTF